MPPLFPITLTLYAVACTLYLGRVLAGEGGARLQRPARWVLALAFLAHAVDIGWLCTKGLHPMVNAREALGFSAWLITGVFLVVSLRDRVHVVGALVAPAALVLELAARLVPSNEPLHAASRLGATHIALATAGVALFAVAAGAAVIYLLAERRLRSRRGALPGGAALETLDKLTRRCVLLGFPVFTVAMITGAVWAQQSSVGMLTVQYGIASAAWLCYAGLVIGRLTVGWRGRRAAVMTLVGFFTTLTVLIIYFLRGAGA
jgi:ABC-type uncharacterized transport system permease subunit